MVLGYVPLPDAADAAVSVFQSSGALELLSRALSAPASLLGLPEPIIPLTLLRPLSGSGGRWWCSRIFFPNSARTASRRDCQRADRLDRDHLLHHRPVLLGSGHQKKPLRRARLAVRRPDGLCRQRGGGAVADRGETKAEALVWSPLQDVLDRNSL